MRLISTVFDSENQTFISYYKTNAKLFSIIALDKNYFPLQPSDKKLRSIGEKDIAQYLSHF